MKEVHIHIPSSKEFIGPIIKFLYDFFSDKGVQESVVSTVVTSVLEAVGNAIVHGNKCDSSKQVEIRFLIHQDSLTIHVHDEGEGFDATTLPDPLDPENILKPYGRGVFLIKNLMDQVSFNFDGSGSTIILKKTFEHDIETE